MQDRFVGDIGDYGKFGLLRALEDTGLTLGVNWYLSPDDDRRHNGQHIGYLKAPSESLSACDPELFAVLGQIIDSGRRSVVEVRQRGLFRDGTRYYETPLAYRRGSRLAERQAFRALWVEEAQMVLSACDLVFVDPDNGLESGASRYTSRGLRHAYFDDLRPFVERGQSLVIYHHLDRSANASQQAGHRSDQLRQELGRERLVALKWDRISPRFYFVVPLPEHEELILDAVASLLAGPWGRHFQRMT